MRYGFPTEDAAHDWLDGEVKRWLSGRSSGADQPLGVFLDDWLRRREPFLASQTIPGYRRAVRYLKPLQDVPLDAVTHQQLGAVWARLRADGLALSTIRTARTIISVAMNDAVPHLIPENPNRRTRVPPPQPEILCWTEEERNAFLRHAAGSDHYALWLLALLHGPRMAGEVRGLRWTDVNWTDGTLTIERSLSAVGAVEGPTKTRRARTIVLAPPVLSALRELHAHRPPLTPWLFAGPDGMPPTPPALRREFDRITHAARLPRIRLYDMRHCAATIALRRGVPLTEVSQMLGHRDPSTTLRYYARWAPSHAQLAAQTIGDSLPPGLDPGVSPIRSPIDDSATR